ncbi:alkane 1-monooxygenase [Undibacterium sp. SXout20W]|uniref:alkane 1-monooxygenase n=1 Tax=Undibacterium sp. SXout20W TaxID=3413051 RepID=UPI003BF42C42
MTSFANHRWTNAIERQWLSHKRYWYLISLLLPTLPLFFAFLAVHFQQGVWLWMIIPVGYIVVPVFDLIFGKDNVNPTDEEVEKLKNDRYFARVLYCATAMHWVALVGMAYTVSHWHWSWVAMLGAGLSAGLVNGVGLAIGHELGHKVNDKEQTLAGKLVLACCGYGHFIVEHNKGHHKDVATPEDPASARFGESVYRFACRELPGALVRGLRTEAGRLQRQHKSWWSPQNEILQQWALTLVAYGLMVYFWGTILLPFFLLAAGFGWWQLTLANYVEHYGLLRQKEASGRYQRCEPKHSWNSNFKFSNLLLVHLQRHSDHHAHPTRPYQVLRDYDEVPQLPQGYFGMFLLAMIPPLWFAVMNHRVVEWANGDMNLVNLDPAKRTELFNRYHQPQR